MPRKLKLSFLILTITCGTWVFKKNYGIKIIVVTNNASSSAAKMSDLALTYYMPSTKNSYFYSSATQVPVLYIIESIANLFIEYGIY